MKPHPRIRKAIKWGGAAVTVLLVVVWVGSGWHSLYWASPGGCVLQACGGRVMIKQFHNGVIPTPCGLVWGGAGPFWLAWCPTWVDTQYSRDVFVPLWIPPLITLAAAAGAWWLDARACRRARLNPCPKCSHKRTGLAASAKCPECGAASNMQPDREGGPLAGPARPSPP